MKNKLNILIDSTYILPAFGIGVSEIDDEDLIKLELLRKKKIVEFYYSDIVWIEIIPKVQREYKKKRVQLDTKTLIENIKSLRDTFKIAQIGPRAIKIAFKLRQLGHKDIIDNLLYGISREHRLYLLTLDRTFKSFLENRGLDTSIIINHIELFKKLSIT